MIGEFLHCDYTNRLYTHLRRRRAFLQVLCILHSVDGLFLLMAYFWLLWRWAAKWVHLHHDLLFYIYYSHHVVCFQVA